MSLDESIYRYILSRKTATSYWQVRSYFIDNGCESIDKAIEVLLLRRVIQVVDYDCYVAIG